MKKSILSIAVMAASLFSFNAIAQTPATCDAAKCPAKECVKGEKCDKPGKPCKADPFAGITLTQDQQTKLDALKANCKANREQASKERADRAVKKDSLAKAGKKEYLENVKAILTPDQYVVFLENIVLTNPVQDRGMGPKKVQIARDGKSLKKDGIKKGDFKKDGIKKDDLKKGDFKKGEKKADNK